MLRAFLAALALAVSSPAAAAEWWWVGFAGVAPTRVFSYVDMQSVKKLKGNLLEVYLVTIAESLGPSDDRSAVARYEIKCRTRQLARTSRAIFDSKGERIPLADITPDKMAAPAAGSMGELMLNFVCGRPSGLELQVRLPAAHVAEFVAKTSGQPAAAAAAQEPEKEQDSGFSTGTGFFIGPGGHVLTSYHVIEGADEIVCRTVSGQMLRAEFVNGSMANDLALLKVDIRPTRYLNFASPGSLRSGDRVFTMGFPMIDRLGTEPRYTEGTVSAMSAMAENSLMQISIPIQPGNSGGPVLTEKGHVVGVIAATEAIEAFYKSAGSLPQNVNWAVKSDYASPLLPVMQPPPPRNREESITLARDSVCLIGARRGKSGE